MDIFEELFGGILSDSEIEQMRFFGKNGMLTSMRGDPRLKPNPEKIKVFSEVLSDVYKLAETDEDIVVIPPDITPDTAFRICVEVPIAVDFRGETLEILQRILPKVSVFGFGIKDEELQADFEGDVETIEFGFVVTDVYTCQ